MNTNTRRGFLGAMFAAAAAPAIVKANSIMRIDTRIVRPRVTFTFHEQISFTRGNTRVMSHIDEVGWFENAGITKGRIDHHIIIDSQEKLVEVFGKSTADWHRDRLRDLYDWSVNVPQEASLWVR